jgi:glutathione S-transferase
VLALYQAEWCPYSSRVREALTELGLDFVAKQVEPWPQQREELERMSGTNSIPVLETETGEYVAGAPEILRYLAATYDPWPYAGEHRQRWLEHR